jgi:hypothetical protein
MLRTSVTALETAMTFEFTRAQTLRLFASAALGVGVALAAPAARADESVKLFKIVTPRDEIVIGVTDKDLEGVEGTDLARLAAKMRAAGQLEVWRYAVRKADSGDLQQAPSSRVMIIYSDTLRIEPYASTLKVSPPA